ncbi:MAG: hypothetical protein PVF34_12940 [Gammaproteobacteria bacterium]|jgi:predicted small lipoprotein YifL
MNDGLVQAMRRTLNNLMRYCVAMVFSLLLVTAMNGCGAKGNLFLPEDMVKKQKEQQPKKKQQPSSPSASEPSISEPSAEEPVTTESTESQ